MQQVASVKRDRIKKVTSIGGHFRRSIPKNKKKRVVLFGSVGKDNDMDLYENVIYIFVMPKLINLYKYTKGNTM